MFECEQRAMSLKCKYMFVSAQCKIIIWLMQPLHKYNTELIKLKQKSINFN